MPRVGKRSLSSVSMRCFCEDEGECYLFLNVAVFFFNIKAKKVSTSFSLFVLPTTAADLLFKGAGACFAEGRATTRKEKVVG